MPSIHVIVYCDFFFLSLISNYAFLSVILIGGILSFAAIFGLFCEFVGLGGITSSSVNTGSGIFLFGLILCRRFDFHRWVRLAFLRIFPFRFRFLRLLLVFELIFLLLAASIASTFEPIDCLHLGVCLPWQIHAVS